MRLTGFVVAMCAIGASAAADVVPLRTLSNLSSITIYEQSGPVNPHTYAPNSSELNNRIASLGGSFDFVGTGIEYYDAFYSNPDGSFNADGAYLTIECLYAGTDGGGNINEVVLNYNDSSTENASVVLHYNAFGASSFPSTVPNAVDGNLATTTFLGQSTDQGNRLSITVGFASNIPAPGSIAMPTAMLLAGARRRRVTV